MTWLDTHRLAFNWSHSRAVLLAECRLKYYWRYYGPYGGNAPWETTDRALLYTLGRLTYAPALVGSAVHEMARKALFSAHEGRPWQPGAYAAGARAMLAKHLKASAKVAERSPDWTPGKGVTVLDAHYYRLAFGAREAQALLDAAAGYMQRLLEHPLFVDALAHPMDLVSIDQLAQFEVAGAPVYAVPDLAQRLPGGRLRLVDWKTGSAVEGHLPRYRDQLAVYALYARAAWGVRAEELACLVADLGNGRSLEVPVDDATLEATQERIATSIGAMRAGLRDEEHNLAHRDDWPMLAPPDTPYEQAPSACRGCAYRLACYGEAVWAWPGHNVAGAQQPRLFES
ncbi:MAG: PD-(D/E)XK nuclease family protein [Anaerolineae bacterium]